MAKDFREELTEFLGEIGRYGRNKFLREDLEGEVFVWLYTDGHKYHIVAKPTYLGCTASTRKPRPGEDWTRGSDLADGNFSKKTWNKILNDIVGYELKSISDYILNPPTDVCEEGKIK